MDRGSQEFYEVRDQFEKDFKRWPWAYGSLNREGDDSPTCIFYSDGKVNAMFRAYMSGYAFAKVALR